MKAAGEKADRITSALERLKQAELQLARVNRVAAEKANRYWQPELLLEKSDRWNGDITIKVSIPFSYIQRQAIDDVHAARRAVVQAGGELPTASEQVQRGRR
jgi:hypothetical protein